MNPEENKMDTITLIELFQPHLLAEAEAALAGAEQALSNIETETAAERAKMAEQHKKLSGEIQMLRQKINPLQECIRMKDMTGLDSSADKDQLAQAEKRLAAMEKEFQGLAEKLRLHEKESEELVANAITAHILATENAKKVRSFIGAAIDAHEAYVNDDALGVGPIAKFKTLKDAIRHFYKVGFTLTPQGQANRAYLGDLVSVDVLNGKINGMIPERLEWLGRYDAYKTLPCYSLRPDIIDSALDSNGEFSRYFQKLLTGRIHREDSQKVVRFYVEESEKILANSAGRYAMIDENKLPKDLSGHFGSLEIALEPLIKELESAETIDLASSDNLPTLADIIRENWKSTSIAISKESIFKEGQGRLSTSQIENLVGAYWKAFIDSPWEPSITGTYALLKHRCARGELPNVYTYGIHGHFGFRVRTPDHDWIIGEIFCPPEHFSPKEAPDSIKVTNLESYGDEWLAELGSVKFRIRKASSRI